MSLISDSLTDKGKGTKTVKEVEVVKRINVVRKTEREDWVFSYVGRNVGQRD